MADFRASVGIDDQFSGPLAKMKSALGGMREEGVKHAGALRKGFDDFSGAVGRSKGALSDVTPVLSGFGLAGAGVGAALGGMAVAIRNFSSSTASLSVLSRETKLSTDSLRAFSALGQQYGVTSETMLGAARNFSQMADAVKRGNSTLNQELRGMGLDWLEKDLRAATSRQDMFKRLLDDVPKINSQEARRKVIIAAFGTDEPEKIISVVGDKLGAEMKRILGDIGHLDKRTEEAALSFEKSWSRIGNAIEKGKVAILSPILEGIADSVDYSPKKRLDSIKADREKAVEQMNTAPPGSFKQQYFQSRIGQIDEEMRKLTREIEESTAKGTEKGVKKALQDGATFQKQSFDAPLGATSLIQKASYDGGALGSRGGRGRYAGLLQGGPRGEGGGGGGGSGYGRRGYGDGDDGPDGDAGARPSAALDRQKPALGPLSSSQPPLKSQGAVPGSQAAREQRAMARLVARGWTPEGAASALGQAATESHVRSDGPLGDTERFGRGDDAAHGMFQWRGSRFRALKAFAADRGKNWQDFDTQVDFFDHETKSRPTARERNWRNETDVYRGNETGKVFEGYSGPLQQQRFRDAQRVLKDWKRGPQSLPENERESASGTMFGELPRPGSGMSRLRNDEIDSPGSGGRPGDQAMRRLYGGEAPVALGKGSLDIRLHGFPEKTQTTTSMEDLKLDTNVSKYRRRPAEISNI